MYVRPGIPSLEFRDDSGAVIPYGERWGMAGPREDTYSVTAHPERFAPLHDVARTLMDSLGVEPTGGGAVFGPLGPQQSLRFDPPNTDAAPIVIALTEFPGVRVRAGAYYSAAFPTCGCDACDEGLLDMVEQLEQAVFAILDGRFSESVSGAWLAQSIEFDDGSSSGRTLVENALPPLDGRDGAPLEPRAWEPWAPGLLG